MNYATLLLIALTLPAHAQIFSDAAIAASHYLGILWRTDVGLLALPLQILALMASLLQVVSAAWHSETTRRPGFLVASILTGACAYGLSHLFGSGVLHAGFGIVAVVGAAWCAGITGAVLAFLPRHIHRLEA